MTWRKTLSLVFVFIFNLWLVKIFLFNVLIAVGVILTSIFAYLSIHTGQNKYRYLLFVFVLLLMVFQYKINSITPLTYLNEDERIQQRQRMTGYPIHFYRFANWLEQRKEAVAFYKIEKNFFEVIDPNLYFFANHPRERAGIVEYEKFPYIYLPFLVVGLLLTNKSGLGALLMSLFPLVLLSLIGNNNPLGPFSMFPFLAVYIAKGLEPVFKNKKYFVAFLIIFTLVFIQTLSYATN